MVFRQSYDWPHTREVNGKDMVNTSTPRSNGRHFENTYAASVAENDDPFLSYYFNAAYGIVNNILEHEFKHYCMYQREHV